MKNKENGMQKIKTELPSEFKLQPRTLVVLDAENLLISVERERREYVNFKAIDRWLHSNYRIIEKTVFIDIHRMNGNRNILYNLGWTFRDVVTKYEDKDTGSPVLIKNAIDIELALETYEYVINNPVDKVLLISGDGGYVSLLRRILKRGIAVDIMAVEASTSRKLVKFADRYWSYEEVLNYRNAVVEVPIEPCITNEPELTNEDDEKDGEEEQNLEEIFRACVEVLDELLAVQNPVHASRFKSELLKNQPSFSERDMGFSRFKDFLIEGGAMDYFDLYYEDNGIWVTVPSAYREEEMSVLAEVI